MKEKKKIVEEKKKKSFSIKMEIEEAEWKKLRKLAIDCDETVGRLVGRLIVEHIANSSSFAWEKVTE